MPRTPRRAFLQLATAGAFLTTADQEAKAQAAGAKQVLPPRLKPGETVGLITPSSYVSDPDELAFAKRFCEFFQLKWKLGKNVGQRYGYLAGTAQQRVDDLRPRADAIGEVAVEHGNARIDQRP